MQAYDKAAPVVKDATDTATPYVKKGLDVAGEVARPVIRAAEPIVKVQICYSYLPSTPSYAALNIKGQLLALRATLLQCSFSLSLPVCSPDMLA